MSRTRIILKLSLLAAVLAGTGCVDRKFIIESNVPNAQVYVDDRPAGPAPAYVPFEYYGYYTVTLVHPGYESVTKRVHVTAPWYAYPPLDFVTEVLWPFHIRDTRRYTIDMHQASQTRTDDILSAAEALRVRGMTLPPPVRPAAPRTTTGPVIGPPVETGQGQNPIPSPLPQPNLVPSVTPPS